MPTAQLAHWALRSPANAPAAQPAQPAAPDCAAYRPAGQAKHCAPADPGLKVPAPQLAQPVAPVPAANWPALQAAHRVVDVAAAYSPTPQFPQVADVDAAWPVATEARPTGQPTHCAPLEAPSVNE